MRILAFVFMLFAGLARAEPYPQYVSPYVNDFAGILGFRGEAQVAESLEKLRSDTGVEFTVVTIETRSAFDPSANFEAFATRLFNGWGIGDAARDDGILLLVATEDREVRLELGRGYGRDWNDMAQAVIDQNILPAFRNGDMRGGVIEGTAATIDRIALPFVAGDPPPTVTNTGSGDGGGGGPIGWIVMLVLGLGVGLVILRNRISDFFFGFKACPNCGAKTLSRIRRVTRNATKTTTGEREVRVTCSNCSYEDTSHTIIPVRTASRRSSSSGGSFGGGSSSGGGASGRW